MLHVLKHISFLMQSQAQAQSMSMGGGGYGGYGGYGGWEQGGGRWGRRRGWGGRKLLSTASLDMGSQQQTDITDSNNNRHLMNANKAQWGGGWGGGSWSQVRFVLVESGCSRSSNSNLCDWH